MEKKIREPYDLRSREWKLSDKLHTDIRDLACKVTVKVPGAQSVAPIANKLVDFQRQIVAQERAVKGVDEREEKEFLCSMRMFLHRAGYAELWTYVMQDMYYSSRRNFCVSCLL